MECLTTRRLSRIWQCRLIPLAALAFAGLLYASSEPTVTVSALKAVEDAANRQFLHDVADPIDPWEALGDARGTYLPGYGAVFTFEMSLVNVMPITPFHVSISAQEIKSVHARKIKKLPLVKSAMQDLIVKSATTLSALPPTEQITVEAFLDYFSFEDRTQPASPSHHDSQPAEDTGRCSSSCGSG